MVRMTAELEVSMNSVERVVEYMPMAGEAPAVIEDHRPPAGWPSNGAIRVEGLVVRYRPELPPVINGLSFATKAKEKVGSASDTQGWFRVAVSGDAANGVDAANAL